MKYFIDTEFIEKPNTIQLVSIGIKCEDGREYYAISKEYNFYDADEWVIENVITPLYTSTVEGRNRNMYRLKDFHQDLGKSIENGYVKGQLDALRGRYDLRSYRISEYRNTLNYRNVMTF